MKKLLLILLCLPMISCVDKNTCEIPSYEIPSYVDTSKAAQLRIAENDSLEKAFWIQMDNDSLFADSMYKVLEENPDLAYCGMDGAANVFQLHNHRGVWVDENGNEWPWSSMFMNSEICPVCNLRYSDYEFDEYGQPIIDKK